MNISTCFLAVSYYTWVDGEIQGYCIPFSCIRRDYVYSAD